MKNVLPDVTNLKINGVYYQYTPIKNTEDVMKVHVQNENALHGGYIFRETDDWSGLPGGIPINKVIGVDNIPKELWGDGSIAVEGTGSVTNASVVYSYKFDDSCSNPLADPSCPGYNDALLSAIASIPVAGAYEVDIPEQDKTELKEELDEEKDEEEEDEERLEKALSAIDNNILDANAIAQNQMMQALTIAVDITSYYDLKIEGGVYNESITLNDTHLPDNKKGARVGLAQQLLHNKMIDMQYDKE